MVLPFKKEAAYFYATDFLQDSGKQRSGKYPSMNPSFSAKSGLLWEATGIFNFWAVQKGIEYFYFPEQNSQFTHVCDGGVRGQEQYLPGRLLFKHWLYSELCSAFLCNLMVFLYARVLSSRSHLSLSKCHVRIQYITSFVIPKFIR